MKQTYTKDDIKAMARGLTDGGPVFRGYTEAELRAGFDRICNPDDWRAPINWLGEADNADVLLFDAAIRFYTATQMVVTRNGPVVHIRATGYREGPAGDH